MKLGLRGLIGPLAFGALFLGSLGLFASAASAYASDWITADGGIFNPPSEIFNPDHAGFGSTGQTLYNKVDLRDGREMHIEGGTILHDFEGNPIATANASGVGYIDGFRDGGLVAGSIAQMRLGGQNVTATYAWSVNVEEGGRQSGWVDVRSLGNPDDSSVQGDILEVLQDSHDARIDIFDSELARADYEAFDVVETRLPSHMEEYYLDPDRDPSKTAGKAKFYYTRDDLLTVSMNIPETGSQRFGVGNNIVPVGDVFFQDMNVDVVDVSIYPPLSSTADSHTLRLAWGYFEAPNGSKVFSWTNERALEAATPEPEGDWVHCADFQETCSLPGPATVRYGADGVYAQRDYDGGNVECSNSEFGNPIRVTKTCDYLLESTPDTGVGITVYQHCSFGGYSVELGAGSFVAGDDTFKNNDISSLKVSEGYRVTVYNGSTFNGGSRSYDAGETIPCLLEKSFNDMITSIIVTKL